jgi:hypothetical protein
MGRRPIGDAPMTPAERQQRARAVTKQASTASVMTSAERSSILVLIRQRERVATADAREYKVTLANFERKLATIYKPSDHPVWKEAHAAAKRAAQEAQAKITATFKELGIPEAWAPGVGVGWYGRGENALAARRAELRRVAHSEADKRLARAEAAIKKASVEAQERVIASGLSSEAAQAMLASLPTPQELLPELDFEAVEQIAAPDRTKPPEIEAYGEDAP